MDETHDLLLALAGRLDDDLLAWARELVAVGEDTRAVELVAAGLAADRVALPAAVRAAVVVAATTSRIDLDADAALPPPGTDDGRTPHRFAELDDERVTAAVRALPARLLDGAQVAAVRRLTPAGTAPGPLPHPVVLVDVEPGGRPADVLAHQLYVALDRAGLAASVEVLTSGRPVPAYHAAARAAACPVDVADFPREPVAAPTLFAERTEQVPVTPPAPLPLRPMSDGMGRRRRATPEPGPRPHDQHRQTVTPIGRGALPSPVPLLRRAGGPARALVPVEPPGEITDQQQAVRPAVEGQVPALADMPTFRPMQDPLSGPLNAPLLAPLLDPTTPGDEGFDESQEYGGAAFGIHGVSPLAPDRGAPIDDGWEGEWASGDWAVAPTDLRAAAAGSPTAAAPADPTPAGPSAPPIDASRQPAGAGPTPATAGPVDVARLPNDTARPTLDAVPRPIDPTADAARPQADVARVAGDAPDVPAAPPPGEAPQVNAEQRPVAGARAAADAVRPRWSEAARPRDDAVRAWGPQADAVQPPAGVARHRFVESAQADVAGPPPTPVAPPEPVHLDLGLRPDSLARLSDADRELLARLQAELGRGRKPRTTRRAVVAPTNGAG